MPAFLVPFAFVLDPQGVGLLLKVPPGGSWFDIVEIFLESAAGIAMLAFAAQGYLFKRNTVLETVLFAIAGLFLVFPALLAPTIRLLTGLTIGGFVPGLSDLGLQIGFNVVLGLIFLVAGVAIQRMRPAAAAASR
jgi:TRAP-type uncharacterized transport system fused permease subunit